MKSEELSEQLKKAGISNEIWETNDEDGDFIFNEQEIKNPLRHNHAVVLECPKGQPLVVISAARAQNLLIDKPKEDDKTINNLREFINKHTNTIAKHSLLNMDLANALELERDTSAKLRQQLAELKENQPTPRHDNNSIKLQQVAENMGRILSTAFPGLPIIDPQLKPEPKKPWWRLW